MRPAMHAWILALAAASALAFGGLRQDRPAAGGDPPEATLEAARIALAERSWEAAGKAARTAGARLAAGSPAWYEAAGIEAEAWYELWRPGDVLAVSEAVQRELAALYERLERDPLGASLPIPAMSGAQDASILGALVLQARGEHDRAARWLDGFVENLLRGRIPPTGWARAAPLAGARSHLLTDRPERARGILEGVVRALPGTVEGVVASVLLQAMGDSYAGVYAGDPDHAKRMQAFAALLADARRRAERATGMREGALDVVLVGVADIPPGREAESGFTLHDPRRPELAPIVCMYAQTLAASSPEELAAHAVHELVHAACLMELGLAYERLPEWVYEGIAYQRGRPDRRALAERRGQGLVLRSVTARRRRPRAAPARARARGCRLGGRGPATRRAGGARDRRDPGADRRAPGGGSVRGGRARGRGNGT